jgi:DNA-binding NarL/FixJ family response regulator
MTKLRIVLADDHGLLRAGLVLLIGSQPDMEVVGEAGDTATALDVVVRTQPDLVTMDLSMPGGSSIKAIETIREKSPKSKVIVVTTHDDPAYLRAALAAGAAGYVVKTISDEELLTALRGIAQGRTVINLPMADPRGQAMFQDVAKIKHPGLTALSERETQVLAQLGRGRTNQEIADKLLLSVKTVETYRSRIGEKLGLKSRSELVAFAMQMGLVDPKEFD